ncbi:unnamed protein product [Owenia fusiformis]|uniref:Uncharacterized protein n=1 Tax=Owenia fusiformis TaxID=6347 RepID=A0A8S4Q6N7_OWEFU|nr:unnamed protein product [Owenia fusiformis]
MKKFLAQEAVLQTENRPLKSQLYAHNFTSVSDPFCKCGLPQTPSHFILKCPLLVNERETLFAGLRTSDLHLLVQNLNTVDKIQFLLYGDEDLDNSLNEKLIELMSHFVKV